ncbi:acetylcholine receptor subunit gamma isoform X2 [Amia ocellicauda]|uniref:acetylcholine receptor subunit gamma isoform X2 n=1 Tax=Amia ocellicauda TaxID=2972642 RepID=UPI003464D126
MKVPLLSLLALLSCFPTGLLCRNQEERLLKDMMTGYNKNIRPVEKDGDVTQVTLKLTLTNLVSLNEREEALMTNVWIEMQWCDYRLKWNTSLYDGIDIIRVPSKSIWLPDIVLENNSQTYSANEIDLVLTNEEGRTVEWIVIDPEAFTENGEWAIKHRPAKKLINSHYSKDDLEYQEVIFFLIIQRKPLFYIINMIVPCVLISSLGLLVYFLPAKAGGQKCTMSISILLAQTVFLFLIAQKVPETSQAVPLIGKFLMFAMTVTTIVVMNCVIVLNVSLRTPSTHIMTNDVRQILLNFVPRLLRMQMSLWSPKDAQPCPTSRRRSSLGLIAKADEYVLKTARTELMFRQQIAREGLMKSVLQKIQNGLEGGTVQDLSNSLAQASPEVRQCVASCNHIATSIQKQNDFQNENEEWFLVGRVVDRVCFLVMALLFALSTVGIFLMGHFNQAPSTPFPGDPNRYLP